MVFANERDDGGRLFLLIRREFLELRILNILEGLWWLWGRTARRDIFVWAPQICHNAQDNLNDSPDDIPEHQIQEKPNHATSLSHRIVVFHRRSVWPEEFSHKVFVLALVCHEVEIDGVHD